MVLIAWFQQFAAGYFQNNLIKKGKVQSTFSIELQVFLNFAGINDVSY